MDNIDDYYDRPKSVVEPLTLSTVERKVVESSDEVQRKTELDTQRAVNETGFGKYNYKTIIVSGMICANVAFSITSVRFILPAATCDFNMNTLDKSRLTSSPILGMLVGSFIWGYVTDTRGRRTALLQCLFLQGIFECLASVISNYWGFVLFKFLVGVVTSGQLSTLFTYAGEFQPDNYRKKALSCMEMAWILGVILAPIIAWIIIPLDINVRSSIFFFKSWSLFVATCSLPAFIVGFLLLRLPETPQYLANRGRCNELLNVLTVMHRQNTGNTTEEYIAKLNNAGITLFTDRTDNATTINAAKSETMFGACRGFFRTLSEQTFMLFRPPYVRRTMITCVGSYCIFSGLYTLMLWFPELFHRFADFEEQHPGEYASVCTVSQVASNSSRDRVSAVINLASSTKQTRIDDFGTEYYCNITVETEVYVHTLLLGLSCIPVAVIFLLTADRVGFRFYLIFNSFCCCAVTIGLLFVRTSTQNLILSCIYEALISMCLSVIYCISVELFPTNLRGSISALVSLFGRLGSLVGNTMVGYLVDDHCLVLISIVAIELFIAGVVSFFLPNDDHDKSKKRQTMSDIPGIGLPNIETDKYHSSATNSGTRS